ncbi:MAG: hypothetical protein ACHP9V_05260 [Terriglobales bacterium]
MAQAFDGIASDVEQLSERLRELERRVSALEGPSKIEAPAPPASASGARAKSRLSETRRSFPASNAPAGVVSVFGKAVLAIAGAYLLRAVAESGIVPQWPVLVVAIVYAGMWLVWAARTHATNDFASVTYAITAALILSPLLWESTVRFQVLWPAFTAAVLVAFVVLALALAWRRNLQAIPWVATVAAVATALALIVATRDLVPFTAALLAVALAAEVVVCLEHRLTVRAVPAIAADLAVWLLVYLMTSSEGVPPEYRPIGATTITMLCLALLAIYGGSIGLRSFGLRHRLTIFEIVQGVVAFGLATFGTLRASPGAAAALGGFFLLVAAVCYWGALSRFTTDEQTLNRRVCGYYSVALLLVGSWLLFPSGFQSPFLCLAAVTAAFLYRRTGKLTLGMHVSFYLAAAAILSGLLNLAGNALAGTVPPALDAGAWVVAVSAGLGYAIGSRAATDHSTNQRKERMLWVVPCVLVAGVAAALAVMVSVRLGSAGGMLNASRLSVVRTVVICLIALVLGFGGSRLKRAELLWVAYVAIAFGTLKLLFEDLRYGNAASLVASLLFYGLILILIPRLTRFGRDGA